MRLPLLMDFFFFFFFCSCDRLTSNDEQSTEHGQVKKYGVQHIYMCVYSATDVGIYIKLRAFNRLKLCDETPLRTMGTSFIT